MIRNLLIIMGVGLILAVVGIGGALAVGGPTVLKEGWSVGWHDAGGDWVRFSHDGDRSERRGAPQARRELEWTGGDRLVVTAPVDVIFTQGPTASVSAEGPQDKIDALRLEGGRLFLVDEPNFRGWRDRIVVTITAPDVSVFEVEGSQTLTLRGLDLPELRLSVSGSGDVEAEGRAQRVAVAVSGSGHADLTALTVVDAQVEVSGSGEVDVGPTGRATIDISGSGDVDLTRRPASVQSTVSGSGDVDEAW